MFKKYDGLLHQHYHDSQGDGDREKRHQKQQRFNRAFAKVAAITVSETF
jgi:hypothetical protein